MKGLRTSRGTPLKLQESRLRIPGSKPVTLPGQRTPPVPEAREDQRVRDFSEASAAAVYERRKEQAGR